MIPACSDKREIVPGAPGSGRGASSGGGWSRFPRGRKRLQGRPGAGTIVTPAFRFKGSKARTQ
jgi:hypothetical protein